MLLIDVTDRWISWMKWKANLIRCEIKYKEIEPWRWNAVNSWIKRDQLDVTSFITSLFNAHHVSDVNTSILRSLRLICWVISWVVLLWFDVCWCYVVVWLGWFKLVSLYSTIKMMHGPINIRCSKYFKIFPVPCLVWAARVTLWIA